MLNQNQNPSVRFPYGDAFLINTPHIDQTSQYLYQEQRQRDAEKRKNDAALDDEFSKNIAGIRDADIPDLTKAYGDWKLANQQLMKQTSVNPQQQMDVLRKKAAMYDLINKSKQFKEQEKTYGNDIIHNNKKYNPDAHTGLIGILKTPVNQIGDTDPFDKITWKGNAQDFNKLLSDSKGALKNGDDEITPNPNGLQKDVMKVQRYNNPVEYFQRITSGLVGSQAPDSFQRTFGNFTPEEYNVTEQHYNQLMSDPVMKKRLGMQGADLPPDENLTDVQRTAKYMAMQHAILNPPVVKSGTPIKNEAALMNLRNKYAMNRMAAMDKNTMKHIQFSHSFTNSVGDPEVLATNLTEAVKSGDGNKIKEAFNPLFGGKGNFDHVEYNPAGQTPLGNMPAQVTVFTKEKEYDPDLKRSVDVIKANPFNATDPNLIDHMRGVIVHTVGASKGQKKAILTQPTTTTHKAIETKGKTGKKIYIPQ